MDATSDDRGLEFAVLFLLMKSIVASLVLFAGMTASNVTYAQDTSAATLLVLAKSDNMLALVDPVSLQVMARIPAGNDPHEVVASTDGLYLQLWIRNL
jgi:hypothetical protein